MNRLDRISHHTAEVFSYAAIGLVLVEFAHAERAVIRGLSSSEMAHMKRTGEIGAKSEARGFTDVLAAWKKRSKLLTAGAEIRAVNVVAKELTALSVNRNDLAHNIQSLE